MDQLAAARAEHNAMMERLQAEFESEVAALRKELAEAYAMMERYRTINEFIRYERSEHDTVN